MFQCMRHSLGTPEPTFLKIHYPQITQPIKAKRASEEVFVLLGEQQPVSLAQNLKREQLDLRNEVQQRVPHTQ